MELSKRLQAVADLVTEGACCRYRYRSWLYSYLSYRTQYSRKGDRTRY